MGLNANFDIEQKPTSHTSKCEVCEKLLNKEEWRFVIRASGYHQATVRSWHLDCFFKELQVKLVGKKRKPRFIEGFKIGCALCGPKRE